MSFKCATVTCYLKSSIGASCLFVFLVTTVAGILLILAPEEPSLSLGGGALYSLWIGIVLLVLAGFVLIAGVCGCICVGKDSTVGLCCLSLFLLVGGALVAGSVSVLFTFTYNGQISSQLNTSLWDHLDKYNTSLFEIQANYSCCGVDDPSDWFHKTYSNGTLPSSCCHDDEKEDEHCTLKNSFTKGCRDVLMWRLQLVVTVSFGTALIGSLLLVFTSILAGYGSCLIKKYQNYDIL